MTATTPAGNVTRPATTRSQPMRLKPVAIGLWIAVFVLGGIWVADRVVAPPAPVTGTLPGAGAEAGPAAGGSAAATLTPFTLTDLAGTPRRSDEWSGSTVLYNFWATWCAPCRREMPLLDRLHQAFAGPPGARVEQPELQVVGIAIDRVEPTVRFVGEIGITYPILVGQMDATRVGESFGVALLGLPYSALVAPGGVVLAVILGELTEEHLALIGDVGRTIATGELDIESARKRLAGLPRTRVPGQGPPAPAAPDTGAPGANSPAPTASVPPGPGSGPAHARVMSFPGGNG